MATALVIENDPIHDVRRLGDWLTDAGLELSVLRPYAGDPVPADLDGYAALVVVGGERRPTDAGRDAGPAGPEAGPADPGAEGAGPGGGGAGGGGDWLAAVESLLRRAVRTRVPTLAVGLGGQLLAAAHGGRVEPSPSGPELGPALVGRRDAADHDPVFAPVPFAPDVLQWHRDEITELPAGAVLLAASPRYPHQAFRIGDRAWGTQFHIECDTAMVADWARADQAVLADLDLRADDVVAACAALMGELEDTWQPFAWRFAALAQDALPEALARRPAVAHGHDHNHGHGLGIGPGVGAGHLPDIGHLAGANDANGQRRQLPLLGQ